MARKRPPLMHLDTPRNRAPYCGADGETSPDINHCTCPKCIAKHDDYLERQERLNP